MLPAKEARQPMRHAAVFAIALCLLGVLLVACSGGSKSGGGQTLSVTLHDDSIVLASEEIKAGQVSFEVKNSGDRPHEFMVIKSDLPPDQLPVKDHKVIEDEVNIAGEIEPFGVGETGKLTLTLSAGKYILICNIVELPVGQPPVSHFESGMNAGLIVLSR